MLKKYHGIIPPIITPVDARENVDESGYRQLLEDCTAFWWPAPTARPWR